MRFIISIFLITGLITFSYSQEPDTREKKSLKTDAQQETLNVDNDNSRPAVGMHKAVVDSREDDTEMEKIPVSVEKTKKISPETIKERQSHGFTPSLSAPEKLESMNSGATTEAKDLERVNDQQKKLEKVPKEK